MASKQKNILAFLEDHPVFTIEELRGYFSFQNGGREASDMLLHNKRMRRIGTIKAGLYYAVRPGQKVLQAPVDPFLLTSKLASDAVLAFHSALDLLGFGHSVFNTYYYFSDRFRPARRFRHEHFRCVVTPEALRRKSAAFFGTDKVERFGLKVVVTSKERTLVEVLERPQYCGGFEEMYRCLEKMPYLQTDLVLQYLTMRQQKKLFARVGFFLEQHREQFQVEESFLQQLQSNRPSHPLYWDRTKKGGELQRRWNLIVPVAVARRQWEVL
jgi:predicted transcriptional regulator of viral defense system